MNNPTTIPANYKKCIRCLRILPVDCFHRQGKYRRSWCKDCSREYELELRRQRGIRSPDPNKTKVCSSCGLEKSQSEFHRDSISVDGCTVYCKQCVKEKDILRRQKAPVVTSETKVCRDCKKNLPLDAFYKNAYGTQGRSAYCKNCQAMRSKINYEKNKAEISRRAHQRYMANRPEQQAKRRAYYRKHPEDAKARWRKRRATKHNAGGNHTSNDIEILRKGQGNICWWCGKPLGEKVHIDHRVALSLGGSDNAENLCITCPECNLRKHNKMPWEWNGRLL